MVNYFQCPISIFVSSFDKKPNQIFELYNEIEIALSRKIFQKSRSIIYASKTDLLAVDKFDYPIHKEKKLLENLMLGNIDEAYDVYTEIIDETYKYPIIIYNTVIARILLAINNVVLLIKKNNQIKDEINTTVFDQIIEKTYTLEERNEKIYDLFVNLKIEIEKKKNDKQDLVISNINNMIDINFENQNFSLDSIADNVGMSVAYMCRLYKKHTGTTINNTLIYKRIEKSKQLLAQSTLAVNEIAEKIGFSSSTYFYRVFKKHTGVTPNEYRKTNE